MWRHAGGDGSARRAAQFCAVFFRGGRRRPAPRRERCSAAAPPKASVEFVTEAARASGIASELLASSSLGGPRPAIAAGAPVVALDCEGVRLGRFGRVCLVQAAVADGRHFLLDALRPGVVEALAPLLESRDVVKVMHDCREDSAALHHQHGVRLQSVFDTQASYAWLERLRGNPPHQASFADMLRERLGVQSPPDVDGVKELMGSDDQLWARRPLPRLLVHYALHGVSHLLPLRRSLLDDAAELSAASAMHGMADASERAVQYCVMNSEFPSASSMAKIGTQLWALVAARTDIGIFFKLNAGRVGLANTPSAMHRFKDVQLGDAVFCCVSGQNRNGSYIYLDRYDHDWDYYDHQLRPSGEPEVGAWGRDHRHESSLFTDPTVSNVDPLLSRGLHGGDELCDAGAPGPVDAWDAEPEDVGLPPEAEDF